MARCEACPPEISPCQVANMAESADGTASSSVNSHKAFTRLYVSCGKLLLPCSLVFTVVQSLVQSHQQQRQNVAPSTVRWNTKPKTGLFWPETSDHVPASCYYCFGLCSPYLLLLFLQLLSICSCSFLMFLSAGAVTSIAPVVSCFLSTTTASSSLAFICVEVKVSQELRLHLLFACGGISRQDLGTCSPNATQMYQPPGTACILHDATRCCIVSLASLHSLQLGAVQLW